MIRTFFRSFCYLLRTFFLGLCYWLRYPRFFWRAWRDNYRALKARHG